jgi:UDP-N-acetylmuramoyl-tripeptide--D-alanyl-D-alanine ligase
MTIPQLYTIYLAHPIVSTDTRAIKVGSIFFALKGPSFNANEFAAKALEAGAAYCIIDEAKHKINDKCIVVDDVLLTLQELAAYHRKQLQIPVIGITGTNGKTTTKELINAVLSMKYKTHATVGNLNNHIGVPLTLLSMDKSTEIAIIEMGANHPGDIKELCDIAHPNYGIITNVGYAHLEGFGSFEGVMKTKAELYDYITANNAIIFINNDNENLLKMAKAVANKISYAQKADATIKGSVKNASPYLSITVDGNLTINTNLVGAYNFENVLAAVCIGSYFKVDNIQIKEGIENYVPSNNRSQVIKIGTNTLLMDAYNANPSSMDAALSNFDLIESNNKTVILGDMFELGDYSLAEHKKLIDKLTNIRLNKVILVGKAFAEHKGIKDWFFFDTAAEAQPIIEKMIFDSSTILIKGSRGMKLESLVNSIK